MAQKEFENLGDVARRVRSKGMLVYNNVDAEQRAEQFRERFIEDLHCPEILEVLFREDTRTFRETVDRAVDLEAITEFKRSRPNKRVDALRNTQEVGSVNSNPERDEITQHLIGMKVAMKSLTETMTQLVIALVERGSTSTKRLREPLQCYVCGLEVHSRKDFQQRRNALNLRGPGDHRRTLLPRPNHTVPFPNSKHRTL